MHDWLWVLIFFVFLISVGAYLRSRAGETLTEFLLAGRGVAGWKTGLSMTATANAPQMALIISGLLASGGVILVWRYWLAAVLVITASILILGLWQKAPSRTDAEFSEDRYATRSGLALRRVKAIVYGLIVAPSLLGALILGSVRLLEAFAPWHEWLPTATYTSVLNPVRWFGIRLGEGTSLDPSVLATDTLLSLVIVITVISVYTALGGLRAVIRTDLMKFLLTLTATYLLVRHLGDAAGGVGRLADEMVRIYGLQEAERYLTFTGSARETGWASLSLLGVYWFALIGADGTGPLAQRALASGSPEAARNGGILFAWISGGVMITLWLLIAVSLLVLVPFPDFAPGVSGFIPSRETVFIDALDTYLPAGARSMTLLGLLAALVAGLDSCAHWGSGLIANDLYPWIARRVARPEQSLSDRERILVSRISVPALLATGAVVAFAAGSVASLWSLLSIIWAGTLVPLTLRWFWERVTPASEIASLAVTLLSAPLLMGLVESHNLRMLLAFLGSSAALGATLIAPAASRAERAETGKLFYRKVSPPGVWSHVAESGDLESRRTLKASLATAAYCAGSFTLIFFGTVKLLLLLPHDAALLPTLSVTAGVALIPFWLRRLL